LVMEMGEKLRRHLGRHTGKDFVRLRHGGEARSVGHAPSDAILLTRKAPEGFCRRMDDKRKLNFLLGIPQAPQYYSHAAKCSRLSPGNHAHHETLSTFHGLGAGQQHFCTCRARRAFRSTAECGVWLGYSFTL